MTTLKSLQFTALQKTSGNPVLTRRTRLVERLEEQRALAKNPEHVRTTQRWVKVDGERKPVTKQQRVRPWWRTDVAGQTVMSVFHGAKPIEFEKGKAGVLLASKEQLLPTIDALISAVRQGELDEQLAQATKARVGKAKRAA